MICSTVLLFGLSLFQAKLNATVPAREVVEVTLQTDRKYGNPFTDLKLDAVVTGPDGKAARVPAFWDGGGTWRFRYSSAIVGAHRFKTECSDVSNPQLQGVAGSIEVTPSGSDKPLYHHGPIGVASDRHHFQYADGEPFFWLGDTWWKALASRISFDGFKQLAADRKTKGFSVVQIVAGPYPDEPAFDPRWQNEGGMPYEPDYRRVNPAYFDAADRRITHLIDTGIVPAIVGGWGWHMPSVGVEKFKRHWRYLIARYAAYPVIWIVGGESGGPQWTEVCREVKTLDPFHRMITVHPFSGARKVISDQSTLDFDMLQTGHDDWGAAANTVAQVTAAVSKNPPMPVVVGEVTYEGHMMMNHNDVQRFMFWTCMLNGAAGHTYGAGGIWQMNSESVRGAEYELTPWNVAMNQPGSTELGIAKRFLEQYPWWQFQPHPEWVDPHSTVLLDPHDQWFDEAAAFRQKGGKTDWPYAAGIQGRVRVVYLPGEHPYSWSTPTITHLEPGASYHAFFFDPVTARRFSLGDLVQPTSQGPSFSDDFSGSVGQKWIDYGSKSKRENGRLVGAKGMVTVAESFSSVNSKVSVAAKSDSESGIILRFHDADNYLVALYSPLLHAIYFHDRKHGEWGSELGKVEVPILGPNVTLTAAAAGDTVAFTVDDGAHRYTSTGVGVSNVTPGPVGLWHYQIGDTQEYRDFKASTITAPVPHAKPGEEKLVLNENPGLLPEIRVPAITLLLSDQYHPPRLPSPQDWVLVLENIGSGG